jgi:hypothetical protein
MKTLFIGLVIGAIAAWSWYHTGGKIYITETKTITNEVVVTVTETQIVKIIQQPQVVTEKPVVPVQPKTAQPAPKQPKQVVPAKWSLSGPRSSSPVKPGVAVPPPAGGGVMFNDGQGRSYRIVNGRRIYY